MLSKAQIIDEIIEINRSASPRWLDRFQPPALRRYLDHLERSLEPRGGDSFWIRPGETAPVIWRNAPRR